MWFWIGCLKFKIDCSGAEKVYPTSKSGDQGVNDDDNHVGSILSSPLLSLTIAAMRSTLTTLSNLTCT